MILSQSLGYLFFSPSIEMHGMAIKVANNHQTMMQSQSAQHAVQAYIGLAKAACLCWTAVMALSRTKTFARSKKTPTRQVTPTAIPRFCLKLRCKKTRETLFLLKSALIAFLSLCLNGESKKAISMKVRDVCID